ncbi:MAG: hypothetical protein K1X72_14230 [Pyrinomonadaceae bacterium]|nr:hypothetical protein [Pyrinomonadaceae bacterium]
MKNLLFAILSIIVVSLSVYSQADLIQDKSNGYSFTAPKEWKNQRTDDGYVFTNKAETANIVVKPHQYKDFNSFVTAEVDLESSGFKLSGSIRDLGDGGRFARVYKPSGDKNLIIDMFFLLSPYNGGVMVMSLTNDSTTAEKAYYTAYEVVKSLEFSRPQPSEQNSQIQAAFGGKKLSYFHTGNGYSESHIIYLCASGSYFSKRESLSSSSIGSGSTYSEDAGTWRVQSTNGAVFLILNSTQGKGQKNFQVSSRQAGNEIGLNGSRYFVETQNQCK